MLARARQLIRKASGAAGLDRAITGTVATGVASQVAVMASGIVAARVLGPEDRGHFALLTLLPTIVPVIVSLGVPLALTYEIARSPTQARSIARVCRPVVLSQLACLVVAQAAVMLILFGSSERLLLAAAITGSAAPGILVQSYALSVMQGLHAFREFNAWRIYGPAAYGLAAIVAAIAAPTLLGLSAAWFFAVWLPALGMLRAVRRLLPVSGGHANSVPSAGTLVSFGARSLLGSQSPLETFRPDQLIVGLALSAADLGYYVAALAFTSLPRFIAQSIGMVVYPRVAAHTDPDARWRAVRTSTAQTTALILALTAGLELAMRPLVLLFFGDDFGPAVPIARVLILAAAAQGARRILSEGARGAGAPGAGSLAEVVSLAIYLPAIAILIDAAGVTGAAWAYVLASVASLATIVTLARRAQRAQVAYARR